MFFSIVMMIAIISSAITTDIEDRVKENSSDPSSSDNTFFVLEVIFISIFTLEFLFKFIDAKLKYFKDLSNLFDFFLVVLGIFGLILSLAAGSENTAGTSENSNDVSSQSRLVRTVRVFRVLRLVRLFRLYKLYMTLKARMKGRELSLDLSIHLHRIATLTNYARAHVGAQKHLINAFCQDDQIAVPAIARVILQSQTYAQEAIAMAVREEQVLNKDAMNSVIALRESVEVVQDLENFVLEAHHAGIIEARETESLLHPMHQQQQVFIDEMNEVYQGLLAGSDAGVKSVEALKIYEHIRSSNLNSVLKDEQVIPFVKACSREAGKKSTEEDKQEQQLPWGRDEFVAVVPVAPGQVLT